MRLRNSGPLLSTTSGAFVSVACTVSELTDLYWTLEREEFSRGIVRRVRGLKMTTVPNLFDEFASSLQFPYYFGENWDALDECLSDLDWLRGRAYLLVVSDALALLSGEPPGELRTLMGILTRISREWAVGAANSDRRPTPFHILFQCEESERAEMRKRLRAAGTAIDELELNAD